MIKFMENIVFSLVQKKDSFLVVEIGLNGARVTKMLVDFHLRSIKILKNIEVDVNDSLADSLAQMDSLGAKIILILDSHIGFTEYSKINTHLEVGTAEALRKLFLSMREKAGEKLGIEVFEVALLDARILNVRVVDGGLEIFGAITCAPKKWIEEIFKVLSKERVVLCVEGVAAFGRVVSVILKDENFILAYLKQSETAALEVVDGNINYLDYFSYGTEAIFNELMLKNKFPKHLIKYAVNSYCKEIGPAVFLDKFGANLKQEYKIIENGLKEIVGKSNSKFLYLASCEAMPNFLVNVRIKNRSRHFIKIAIITHNFISAKLGFEVKYKVEEPERNFDIELAGLFDFYLSQHNKYVS